MDDCPPNGVRRPDPGLLLEHDDYSVICADLRQFIRGRIAAARDRVSVWELPSLPETQAVPALSVVAETGRDTRRKRPPRTRRKRAHR